MKSIDEIIAYIARRLGEIYYGQPMYGFTGQSVDQLIHAYLDLWAEVVDRREELTIEYRKVLKEDRFATASFSKQYSLSHPESSEEEIAQYVVNQWRKVSDRLGVPIPHEAIKAEMASRKPLP